jgi:hypothetical protein
MQLRSRGGGARADVLPAAEPKPEVVVAATFGYRAADVLQVLSASVHMAHPFGNNWLFAFKWELTPGR